MACPRNPCTAPGPAASTIIGLGSLPRDPHLRSCHLEALCEHDPALAQRLLALANGGTWGPDACTDPHDAIRALGLVPVLDMMVESVVADLHSDPAAWRTARWIGQAAGVASAHVAGVTRSEAATAGLMCTIGWALLCQSTRAGARLSWDGRLPPAQRARVERKVFGIDQASFGEQALRRWGFSQPLCLAVGTHTAAPATWTTPLQTVVGAATLIANAYERGESLATCEGVALLRSHADLPDLALRLTRALADVPETSELA